MKRCRSCKEFRPRDLYNYGTSEKRICQLCIDDLIENGRTCKKCGVIKPISDYKKRSDTSWNKTCKPCEYLENAEYVRINPERKAYYVLQERKRYATSNNLEYDLDLEWYMAKLNAGVCEVTGIKFQMNHSKGNVGGPHEPAIDRINPGGDYTKDNCRLVCRIFNIARGNYTDDVFFDMCLRVVEKWSGIHISLPAVFWNHI